jgi:hypothetical protein
VGFGDIPCWVEPTDRVVGWGVAGRVVLDRLDQHFLAGGDDRARPERSAARLPNHRRRLRRATQQRLEMRTDQQHDGQSIVTWQMVNVGVPRHRQKAGLYVAPTGGLPDIRNLIQCGR